MRFKTNISHVDTLTKLTNSLSSLGKLAWMKLSPEQVCFTIIPEKGTQVWAELHIDTLFDEYHITSAAQNVINLEIPLDTLHRALRSCGSSPDPSLEPCLRLTKRSTDQAPVLCLTVNTLSPNARVGGPPAAASVTTVIHQIPVRVLNAASVQDIHEPNCPEPDVHIILPPLSQLRAISERFNRLTSASTTPATGSADTHRLVLSANMQGEFKMRIDTDAVKVESSFRGLMNPELDPALLEGRMEEHPSTTRDRAEFAEVRVEGKEWVRLLKIHSLSKRVIACFCENHALVLYVYLTDAEDDHSAVLTYYMSSYSV